MDMKVEDALVWEDQQQWRGTRKGKEWRMNMIKIYYVHV